MKKIIGLLFILLLITNTAFAFPNEPEGFRNLKWDDSLHRLYDFYPNAILKKSYEFINSSSNSTKFNVYEVKLNNTRLNNLKLNKNAEYIFCDNKFVGVSLNSTLKQSSNFKNIESDFIQNMISYYGHPSMTKTYCTAAIGTIPKRDNTIYITRYDWFDDNETSKTPLSCISVKASLSTHIKTNHNFNIIIFKHNLWNEYLNSKIYTINNKQEIKKQGW